jgi:hypothetical protein
MVRFSVLSFFVLATAISEAQSLQFSNLVKLPPVINSGAEESMPLLSPDQTKLFFVRSVYEGNTGGKYAGLDIWCSEKTHTGWKSPTNRLELLNDKDNNILIGINQDGSTLYTLKSSPSVKLEGIYFTTLSGNKKHRPEFVPLPGIDNQDFVGMYVVPTYDVIFLTMRGADSKGEEDLYVCLKDESGAWSKPKNLGATINTSGFEISPFLSADKKRLYFSSNGHNGLGDADIFYSERLYNSWETWSAPVNLGDVVNSKKFDAYFSIYGDSTAYFTSNRESNLSDIYKVNVTLEMSLLAPGEKYLTVDEWNNLVGKNIEAEINFRNEAKELSPSQRELLYYMANKISELKDIKVHVVVKKEEDSELTRTRLREIYGELRQAGIESYRIKEEQQPELIERDKNGLIQIRLYR